jgi:hypothetical protein
MSLDVDGDHLDVEEVSQAEKVRFVCKEKMTHNPWLLGHQVQASIDTELYIL